MKNAWRGLVIGVVLVGASGLPAGAQPHPMMMREGGRGPWMLYMLFKSAGLTADQETRIRGILAAHRAGAQDLVGQLRAAREEMVDKLLAPDVVTADALQPLRQRIVQLEDQLSQDRLAAALEIRALLTPDQLAKVQRVKDRIRELHAEIEALLGGRAKP